MDKKMYLLDGVPVSANELIAEAELYDNDFAGDWMKTTSKAAKILREAGYSVRENPDYEKKES